MTFAAIFVAASGLNWKEAKAAEQPSTVIWAGIGLQEDTFAAFAGGIWAPSGKLDATGVQFRGELLFVDYEFKTGLAPGGEADGELSRANASIGYHWALDGGIRASLFGGIDFQDRDISPSAADNGKLDDDVGVIVIGRLATTDEAKYPASLGGKYSTANDDYWVQARVGYNFGTLTVGPQVVALGNEDFDAIRVGGHGSFNLSRSVILQINAGYNFGNNSGSSVSSSDDDGIYGGGTVVILF